MASLQPDLQSNDHYKVLGVSRDSSDADIIKAYKKLALKYHPDKNQNEKEQAERNFKRVSDSYSVLCDAQKRHVYDQRSSQGGGSFRYQCDSAPGVFLDETENLYKTLFGAGMSKGNKDLNVDPCVSKSPGSLGSRSMNFDVGRIFDGYGLGNKKSSVRKDSACQHPAYAVPVNTLVVIRGLVNAAEHNGKTGRVETFDEAQRRYKVILDDNLVEIMVKPRNLTQQCSIEVMGIEGRPELNGASGYVFNYHANNSEYVILLGQYQKEICIHRGNCLLKQGTRITLEGLSNEKFNGEMAQIVGVNRCDCRYVVQCQNGDQIKVKFDKAVC